ncbi:MAG: transcription termination/antitermination protein NusA [Candidatus Nomurabacteria bacterium]|nr:MAG: transcription termination/antitermination protein NusA [Candidatus Nomurabacteria bacterium]
MAKEESAIKQAIEQICAEKNIPYDSVIATIEAALAVAYRKDFGEKNQNIKAKFDVETGTARVFDVKIVGTDELKAQYEAEREERERAAAEAAEQGPEAAAKHAEAEKAKAEAEEQAAENEEEEERWDPKTMIGLSEAKALKEDAELGEEIWTELFPPAAYGRMAAQTAKQVIVQRLREAERETIYQEFKDKEGEIIAGVVQRLEGRMVLVDLGHATALMPPQEQVDREQYAPGLRMKFYVVSVNTTPKGPEIIVSRSHPEMVRRFFTVEVPEVQSGAVEIKAIAREAGSRTKVAVFTDQKNIDPVGSCVGQRGTRVQTIIAELSGEKIDIIEWSNDAVKFISNALSPAKILSIKLNEEEKAAVAEVKEDQLSLAIGKSGQNVRLAAKLTGWKIDIVGEGQDVADRQAQREAKEGEEGEAAPVEASASPDDETPSETEAAPAEEEKAEEAAPEEANPATEGEVVEKNDEAPVEEEAASKSS